MTFDDERLTAEEYIDFLKRAILGSQYPKERFRERIEKLVRNVGIGIAARAARKTSSYTPAPTRTPCRFIRKSA